MNHNVRFLIIGDVVGNPGLAMFQKWIPSLKQKYKADSIIVNGENSAKNGKGITPKILDFFKEHGASVVTTGNHVWEHREIYSTLSERSDIIRPANYPPGCQGKGYAFYTVNGHTVAVVNLMGRVFMRELLDCPFRTIESLLVYLKTKAKIIIVDFHAEATAEKKAFGAYLDGKVSCIFGTHTHIQTADEYIMPQKTAYITDLGSCGSQHSSLGVQFEQAIDRFLLHPYTGRFVVETKGPMVLSGIVVDIDAQTGHAIAIERVRVVDDSDFSDSEKTK